MSTNGTESSARRYIQRLEIAGYGCIKDASFKLTPIHAFVGPNDSGKSTVLRGVQTLLTTAADRRNVDAVLNRDSRWPATGKAWLRLKLNDRTFYRVGREDAEKGTQWQGEAVHWVAPATLLRLDPDALRQPSMLIPRGNRVAFSDEHGTGLPGVLEAIRDRDEEGYAELRDHFRRMFPLVRALHLPSINASHKVVEVQLRDGKRVAAEAMSEGMLYFLAFLASAHADRAPVLLVEEPENGLHPSRIAEVMGLLREMSKSMQVLIATHSPLVINELSGDEVTVIVRDEEHGTRGTLLSDTPNFEKRSKVYALGELWVSYANGTDEAPLLRGEARTAT